MIITFWGVRALTPVPGKNAIIHGGNTICISVENHKGDMLIFDAGTGIVKLGNQIVTGQKKPKNNIINLFITGSYFEHIQGFPFFVPIYMPQNKINCYTDATSEKAIDEVLEMQMHPLFSPIQSLNNLQSDLNFKMIDPTEIVTFDNMEVSFIAIDSNSCCISVKSEGKHLIYAPDIALSKENISDEVIKFMKSADCLICDSISGIPSIKSHNYSNDGIMALEIALKAEIQTMYLIHYHYSHTDSSLEQFHANIVDKSIKSAKNINVFLAKEGASFVL